VDVRHGNQLLDIGNPVQLSYSGYFDKLNDPIGKQGYAKERGEECKPLCVSGKCQTYYKAFKNHLIRVIIEKDPIV